MSKDRESMGAYNRHQSKTINKILVEHYKAKTDGYDKALQNMLTDVRHFCDYSNLVLGDIDRRAHQNYRGERQAAS